MVSASPKGGGGLTQHLGEVGELSEKGELSEQFLLR